MKSFICCVWIMYLGVFSASVFAAPKYCSSSGAYYCALTADDPATSDICSSDISGAIITGVNIAWTTMSDAERYTNSPDWDGPSEWTYQYDATSNKDLMKGVSAKQVYHRSWTSEIWWPSTQTHTVSVYLYDCLPCEYPYSWDSVNNQCVKYCPPSQPILNSENGICESEGPLQCEVKEANPVVVATGEKVQYEQPDYQSGGDFPIVFIRNYRSNRVIDANPLFNYQFLNVDAAALFGNISSSSSGWKKYIQPSDYESTGSFSNWSEVESPEGEKSYTPPEVGFQQWSHNYQYSLWISDDGTSARLQNPKGEDLRFDKEGDLFVTSQLNGRDLRPIIEDGNNLGWHYQPKRGVAHIYDLDGKLTRIEKTSYIYHSLEYSDDGNLIKVSHSLGGNIRFSYNSNGQLSTLVSSDQKLNVNYSYDSYGNLILVTFRELNSDGGEVAEYARQYHYESDRHPYALTGITDERGIRYVTWEYDDMGRVTKNSLADEESVYTFEYPSESKTTVTNPLGKQADYLYSLSSTSKRLYKVEGQPSANCLGASRSISYNNNGLPYRVTDWEGNETMYGYNSRGLETVRQEALFDEVQRRTDTEWHPTEPWPIKVTTESEIVEYDYDSNGNILSETRTQK